MWAKISKGWFSSSRITVTKGMCISKIISFIGIAKLSTKTVATVSSPPFSHENACVTPEIISSNRRKEDESSKSANSTPFLKTLCCYHIIRFLWSDHFITPWTQSLSLTIFSSFNTSHWFSVWLYLFNTKWDWTVICLDLTIPYQTFMI